MEALSGHDRVRAHTAEVVNRRLDRETQGRIEQLRGASDTQVARRLEELDREWDVERALMMFFSVAGGITFTMAVRSIRPLRKWSGWLYLLATQIGFMGLHATYGWCPPLLLLRRLGFRTHPEIDAERRSLELMATPGALGRQ